MWYCYSRNRICIRICTILITIRSPMVGWYFGGGYCCVAGAGTVAGGWNLWFLLFLVCWGRHCHGIRFHPYAALLVDREMIVQVSVNSRHQLAAGAFINIIVLNNTKECKRYYPPEKINTTGTTVVVLVVVHIHLPASSNYRIDTVVTRANKMMYESIYQFR